MLALIGRGRSPVIERVVLHRAVVPVHFPVDKLGIAQHSIGSQPPFVVSLSRRDIVSHAEDTSQLVDIVRDVSEELLGRRKSPVVVDWRAISGVACSSSKSCRVNKYHAYSRTAPLPMVEHILSI